MQEIQLTQEQRQIVESPVGNYVITAVAGSGKTTTLAHRIQYLLSTGVTPQRLLVLMFNKSAQVDFSRKLGALSSAAHSQPEVRTFHAMGYRLYQRFVNEGYLQPFHQRILSDKETQLQLWRLMLQHLDGDTLKEAKREKKEQLALCLQFIEAVKSTLDSPEIVFDQLCIEDKFRHFIDLFHHFESWRHANQRISYADMLYDPVRAIEQTPQLASLVSNKMDVILVDEYQDTNDIQHRLLKHIAGERAKITVVGDPDQTIYEFRGAKPEYMLKGFSQDFSDAQHLSLSYSFRYGHKVALLANHLISSNKGRRDILCKSHDSTPQTEVITHEFKKPLLTTLQSFDEDALNQSAILVRVWSQTVGLELKLLENQIPYRLSGHLGVFHSDEMTALVTLLEVASGHFATQPPNERQRKLESLFKFPHVGIPETQIRPICAQLAQLDKAWGEQLKGYPSHELKKIQAIKLERLASALSLLEKVGLEKIQLKNARRAKNVAELLNQYIDQTQLYEGLRSLSLSQDQAEERVASVQGIVRFVSSLKGDIPEILQHLDNLRHEAMQNRQSGLHISTIHRAKGLEWDTVFLPDIQDKIYPYSHRKDTLSSSAYIESERRLLYVAMTRAKKALHLFVPSTKSPTYPSRFQKELNIQACIVLGDLIHAQENEDRQAPANNQLKPSLISSRYLKELGKDIEIDATTSPSSNHSSSNNAGSTPSNDPIWFSEQVIHTILGRGQVIGEQGESFTVRFDSNRDLVFSKATAHRFFETA